ncbi:MAG: hypothetical protein GY847_20675 [Proteobacteria bacterium]|nr:hypothetical protein [Pseudomonadota bacterium]
MKELVTWMTIGTLCLLMSAFVLARCVGGNSGSLAGEGESCAKTSDCGGLLRCVDQVCMSDADNSGGDTDTDTDTDFDAGLPEEDLSYLLFDSAKIIEVEIEMAPQDWDAVRFQTRNLDNFLNPNCLAEPFYTTFTYRTATVTVDGEVFQNAGVRKKGFVGSIHSFKPSLKVKFDKYVQGQELYGFERLTLNNNKSDRTHIVQCFTYSIFTKLGVPAPRCNFAHVTVNGQNLGLYSNIESIKKRFLSGHFENPDGRLYEGTLSDFRDGWTDTFEAKTLENDPDRSDITAMQAALEAPDDELEEALAAVLDIDQFIKFWIGEILVGHGDGYTGNRNNYYFYVDPITSLMSFIPWGVDMTMTSGKTGSAHAYGEAMLARRLYALPATNEKLFTTMQHILDTVWDADELLAEIDAMEALIAPIAADDPFHGSYDLHDSIDSIRGLIPGIRENIQALIDNPHPLGKDSPDPRCYTPTAEITGSFQAIVSTSESDDPLQVGSGELSGAIDGDPIVPEKVGAEVILPEGSSSKSSIRVSIVAKINETSSLVAEFPITEDDLATGVVNFGWTAGNKSQGSLSIVNRETGDEQDLGYIWSGRITFTVASATEGEPVEGSFLAKWYENE